MAGNKAYNYGRGAYGALAYAGLAENYDTSDWSRVVSISTPILQVKTFLIPKTEGISPKLGDPVQVYWKDEDLNFRNDSSIIQTIENNLIYDGNLSSSIVLDILNYEYYRFEKKFIIKVEDSIFGGYKIKLFGFFTGKEYFSIFIKKGELVSLDSESITGNIYLSEEYSGEDVEAIYDPFHYRVTLLNGIKLGSLIDERYKIIIGYGADSNSEQKIYFTKNMGYIKDIIDEVAEKNYLDLSISETGIISLNMTNYISKENILELDNKSPILASSPRFTRDAGKLANKIFYTGYKETLTESYDLKILNSVAKDNLYFKLPESDLGSLSEEYNNGNIIVDYALLGNGQNYSFKQELFITEGYYKEIQIPVSRFNASSSDYAIYSRLVEDGVKKFSQLNKTVSDTLNLNTIFLYFKGDKTVNVHVGTVKKTISNLDLTINDSYSYEVDDLTQIIFDYCVMVDDDVVLELPITKDWANSSIIIHRGNEYDSSLYKGDIYFVGSWSTDSYLEFKVIESPNNYFLSELIERNQEVSYTTKKQIGKVYCRLTDAITNQEVFLLSGSGDTFQTSSNFHSDNLIQYLDYDLRYLEVKNQKTGLWKPLKVKSYTSNTITFYESVTLDGDYILKNNKCEVRRVFITTDSSLEKKSLTDDIYEAYIIKDRNAFGFNYQLDEAHIENILNSGTNIKGWIYSLNRIIGAEYKLEKNVIKSVSNAVSMEDKGSIVDLVTQQYTEKTDFDLAVVTETNYRSESVLKINLDLKYSEIPTTIKEIKLLKYNNPRYGLKNYRVTNYQMNIKRRQCNNEKAFSISIEAEELME